tara:strand:+ start:521 stop:1258 length:738 start_codon:yes stop_codon:yes gene_type:complete
MDKIVATIEARMTSSRLPGKPLLKVFQKTMIEHLVLRLKKVNSIDKIVLATTVNEEDDVLISAVKDLGINIFRGDENDVMQRVIEAADSVDASTIVEITGDCPLIDPQIIEQCIRMYKIHDVDYVSNAVIRSYPDGMDTQVFSLKTLKKSASMTNDLLDREHVSLHIRNNPKIFKQIHLVAPPEIHWPSLGITLDEIGDYELIKIIIENLYKKNPYFSCLDIVKFLRKNPKYLKLNEQVNRKGNN